MRKAVFLCSFIILILSFLYLSCTADKEETFIDLCEVENISFSSDIEPVLDASCLKLCINYKSDSRYKIPNVALLLVGVARFELAIFPTR